MDNKSESENLDSLKSKAKTLEAEIYNIQNKLEELQNEYIDIKTTIFDKENAELSTFIRDLNKLAFKASIYFYCNPSSDKYNIGTVAGQTTKDIVDSESDMRLFYAAASKYYVRLNKYPMKSDGMLNRTYCYPIEFYFTRY